MRLRLAPQRSRRIVIIRSGAARLSTLTIDRVAHCLGRLPLIIASQQEKNRMFEFGQRRL